MSDFNMSKPPVGVVIVNWNLKDSLRETLLSFRKVDYPSLQIVVSDNASTDGSVEMVRAEFPEVHLMTRERGLGYAKGASLGVEYLLDKAKYIFSTTNDVEVAPDMISRLVDYGEQNPTVGMIGIKIYFFDRPNVIWHAGARINPFNGYNYHLGWERKDRGQHDLIRECDYVTGCGVLLRSGAIKKTGAFKEDLIFYFEDADLCYRVRDAGYKIVYLPTAKMYHKVETTLAKNRGLQLHYITRNGLYLLQKHRIGFYPLSLLAHIFVINAAKILFFALLLRWANCRGIWRGIRDWRRKKYGWILD